MQYARSQFNVSEVTLNVRKSNEPALGLYTSLKFYTTKTKPGFCESVSPIHREVDGLYHIDDDGEDAFAMNLLLGNDVNT